MKISINKTIPRFILVLLCIRAYCAMGVDYFVLPYAYNAQKIFVFTGIVLILFVSAKFKLIRLNIRTILCLGMMAVIFLWNNYDFKNGNYYRTFSFSIVLIFYLAFQNLPEQSWKDLFVRITIFVGCFYAFFTILTFVSPSIYKSISNVLQPYNEAYNLMSYYNRGYMAGITSHYTANGIFLQIGVVSLGAAYFFNRNKMKSKKISLFVLLLVFFSLLITGKRAHTIFTVAAFLFVVYIYNSNKKKTRLIKIIGILGVLLLGVILVSFFVPEVLNVVSRFVETEQSGSVLSGRDVLQLQLYSMIGSNPLTGAGWAWFPYNNAVSVGDYAHNVYLQLFGEVGIIGAIPFITFFVVSLVRGVKELIRIRKGNRFASQRDVVQLCASIAYQVVFILYCASGNPLYDYVCYFTYFAWCAVQEILIKKIDKDHVERNLICQ